MKRALPCGNSDAWIFRRDLNTAPVFSLSRLRKSYYDAVPCWRRVCTLARNAPLLRTYLLITRERPPIGGKSSWKAKSYGVNKSISHELSFRKISFVIAIHIRKIIFCPSKLIFGQVDTRLLWQINQVEKAVENPRNNFKVLDTFSRPPAGTTSVLITQIMLLLWTS